MSLLLVGCQEVDTPQAFVEGKEYAFDMNVMLSGMDDIQTRAFRDNVTGFPPLWLVVFDNNGYFVEAAKATNFSREGNVTNFSVVLTATSQPRIVHLLLNYVDDSVSDLGLEYEHENNLIGSMVVSGDRDVYWQRVEVPGGINEASINTSMVKVPLLRNFLKIAVHNNCDYFSLTGFYVMNVPNEGSVAPYVNGEFFDWKESKTYEELESQGYSGFMPDDVTFKNQNASNAVWQTAPFYLYEKPFDATTGNSGNTLTVLLKGMYKNGSLKSDTYYKVDIIYKKDGVNYYYDLIRNFVYNISIDDVTGDGAATPEEAARGAANNNMSSSVNLKDLLNISDGTSALYVSYIDTTLTTTDDVLLKFKYIPNIDNPNNVRNDLVNFTRKNTNLFESIDFNRTEVDSEGWSTAVLSPKDIIPTAEISEALIVYVENLSREVTFRLRPKYDMQVECFPRVIPTISGSDLLVNVKLPNNLNRALFPLDLHLTSVAKVDDGSSLPYISPHKSEYISVELIDGVLYFVKALDYEDYLQLEVDENMRVVPLRFITNIEKSASIVFAYNKYFNDANDNFRNTGDSYISHYDFVGAKYYGVGNDITFELTVNEPSTYLLSSDNLDMNPEEITLSANSKYSKVYKTTTWSEKPSVSLAYDYDGEYVVDNLVHAEERNVLKMKASHTSSSDLTLFDATNFNVYLNESDAKNYNTGIISSVTNSILKYNGVEMQQSGLQENSEIWFAYLSGLNVYTASTTAKELYDGTAVLKFGTPIMLKPTISNIKWTNADYYGVNKSVTLSFQTDKPEFAYSINSSASNLNLTNTTVSGNTITMTFTTKTWSDAANVMITVLGVDAQQITGPKRNKLTVKLSGNSPSSRTPVTMSVANVSQSWSNWKNGQTVTVDNLESNTSIQFSYTSGRTTYSATTTAQVLANGTVPITFKRQ